MPFSDPFFARPQCLDALDDVPAVHTLLGLFADGVTITIDDGLTYTEAHSGGGIRVVSGSSFTMNLENGRVSASGFAFETILWLTNLLDSAIAAQLIADRDYLRDLLRALGITREAWTRELWVQRHYQNTLKRFGKMTN